MFHPRYTITDLLLANIKRINTLVNELNNKRFPNVVLLELITFFFRVFSHFSAV